jgi:DNA processing protein
MDPGPWIALNSIPGVGRVLYKRLILRFGSPEEVFRAPEVELFRVEGAKPASVKAIKQSGDWSNARLEAEKAREIGAEIVTFSNPRYPANLRETHDPPPYLYVKGRLVEGDKVSVAVVGSRKATQYGRQLTKKISGDIAAKGVTIVSGGARGIDTEAHKGAIEAGGRTIAVLGCGIDVVYPPENASLFKAVAESGAVVTEFPVGTPPDAANFPQRNRIISGISMGVVVMEAADVSGSLITASYSLDQGREVYAVPGSVASPTSRGTNSLIKKGAKLVEGSEDILVDLFPYMKGYLRELDLYRKPEREFDFGADEKALFELINLEPAHIDALAEKTGVPVSKALSLLLGMELKGAIRQVAGMNFIRET